MRKIKVTIFGGPIPQLIDSVTWLFPTGKGILADEIAKEMKLHFDEVQLVGNFNGNILYDFKAVEKAIEKIDSNVVIFMPHLPNFLAEYHPGKIRIKKDEENPALKLSEAPKLLGRVKKLHPEVLLIPFKLADPEMPLVEIIRWMLNAHAALAVYSRLGDSNKFWIVDALGNEIACDKKQLPEVLAREIEHFVRSVRFRSENKGEQVPPVPYLDDFVSFSRNMQPAFSQIIEKNVSSGRWPGNFSFRCTYGFMSGRCGNGFIITKRNIDKTGMTKDDFVYVDSKTYNGKLYYYGPADAKPSIDAPVHRYIYENIPWVQAIVHGHLFCTGEHTYPEKLMRWPCGAENEAYEIVAKAPKETADLWVVNVKGHGFVALIGSQPITTGLKKLQSLQYAMNH